MLCRSAQSSWRGASPSLPSPASLSAAYTAFSSKVFPNQPLGLKRDPPPVIPADSVSDTSNEISYEGKAATVNPLMFQQSPEIDSPHYIEGMDIERNNKTEQVVGGSSGDSGESKDEVMISD